MHLHTTAVEIKFFNKKNHPVTTSNHNDNTIGKVPLLLCMVLKWFC